MNKWWNILAQLMGFTMQSVIPTFVTNSGSQEKAAAIVAATQGVVAVIAHYYNPDGTKATTAYVK